MFELNTSMTAKPKPKGSCPHRHTIALVEKKINVDVWIHGFSSRGRPKAVPITEEPKMNSLSEVCTVAGGNLITINWYFFLHLASLHARAVLEMHTANVSLCEGFIKWFLVHTI